jgi:hypothetical protein
MSGIILRWPGGGGGDTILNLLLSSNDVYTNIHTLNKMNTVTGRSLVTSKFDKEYPSFYKLAGNPLTSKIDKVLLKQDIIKLTGKKDLFVLKMHLFDQSFDQDICNIVDIVDIGFKIKFLPFLIRANLNKTLILVNSKIVNKSHFDSTMHKIAKKLTDDQNKKIVIWNIIKDMINKVRIFNLENASIMTEDLFYDRDHLKTYFQSKNLMLDITADYFDQWVENNKKLLPSNTFQNYIENTNYNHLDDSLDIVERYILLALSGKNFKFID